MMKWAAYSALFGLATFKFMFAAFPGPALNISFLETYLSVVLGGTFSSAVFYFASDFFMIKANQRRKRKIEQFLSEGKGTRLNENLHEPISLLFIVNKSLACMSFAFGLLFFSFCSIGKYYCC